MITLVLTFVLMLQQPSLEQQARQFLEKAEKSLADARDAYSKHEIDVTKTFVQQVQINVEAAQVALAGTGKDARRKPKQFKYGEVKTREMLKHLHSFENDMDVDDRGILKPTQASVQEVHDGWLLGIMGVNK